MKLTEHFGLDELACHCPRHNGPWVDFESPFDGTKHRIDRGRLPPGGVGKLRLLAEFAEKIRAIWGKPIRIYSGYRCPVHNAAIGGAKRSAHLLGEAFDGDVVGVSPAAVQKRLMKEWKGVGGTLISGLGCSTRYTHMDRATRISRWRYSSTNRPIPYSAMPGAASADAEGSWSAGPNGDI